MNNTTKKLIAAPIILFCILFIAIGSLCLGYSFMTLVINKNYVEIQADVVKKANDDGSESVVLQYVVDNKTYAGNFSFLESKVGTKFPIGYNPNDPTRLHLGDQKMHYFLLIWGAIFEAVGIAILLITSKLKNS